MYIDRTLTMFQLPMEIQALIYEFDATFHERRKDVLRGISGLCVLGRNMSLDRGYTIRNYIETWGHCIPRYVRVDLQGRVEVGGRYVRVNEKGYRCFAGEPL